MWVFFLLFFKKIMWGGSLFVILSFNKLSLIFFYKPRNAAQAFNFNMVPWFKPHKIKKIMEPQKPFNVLIAVRLLDAVQMEISWSESPNLGSVPRLKILFDLSEKRCWNGDTNLEEISLNLQQQCCLLSFVVSQLHILNHCNINNPHTDSLQSQHCSGNTKLNGRTDHNAAVFISHI